MQYFLDGQQVLSHFYCPALSPAPPRIKGKTYWRCFSDLQGDRQLGMEILGYGLKSCHPGKLRPSAQFHDFNQDHWGCPKSCHTGDLALGLLSTCPHPEHRELHAIRTHPNATSPPVTTVQKAGEPCRGQSTSQAWSGVVALPLSSCVDPGHVTSFRLQARVIK